MNYFKERKIFMKKRFKEIKDWKGIILMFILFFGVLGYIGLTSAAQITNVNTNEGYQIYYHEFSNVKQNSEFMLHLHISNISTGLQIPNTQADCYLHLYTIDGNHTFESKSMTKNANGYDYEVYISSGNFSRLGTHGYYLWCNSTYFGGEVKGLFEVTPDGLTGALGFLIIWLILSLGIILLGYYAEDNWVVILGAFVLILFGLYTLFYGINGVKDTVYTWGIGIVTIMLGVYFGIRGAIESLN